MAAHTDRKGMALHTKILIGLLLGATAGGLAQAQFGRTDETLQHIVKGYMQPLGSIFMNMIFMVVVPLLLSALVLGVMEIGDARRVGRVGLRCIVLTVILSGIAVSIGLIAVNLVKPGAGISAEQRASLMATYSSNSTAAADAAKNIETSKKSKTAAEVIAEFVPKNPLQSAIDAFSGGLLPFMFFALVFGIAMTSIDAEKALVLKQFFEAVFAVTLKIIDYAMAIAPYGVFCLIFSAAALLGWDALAAVAKYASLVLVTLAIHMFVVYPLALRLIAKRDPWKFFGQIRSVMYTAFGTASSNATLPVALRVAEENVGLPRSISNFVLTVGATANQNGTALFEGITILFLAQFFGVDLSFAQQATVMGLAILAGVGTAGVPGGAWPAIAAILATLGVPPEGIVICIGIDRILDMSRTVLNVTGDITIAACVTEMESKKTAAPALG